MIKMNKVQDISTPLATVVSRDFLNDPTPIGADQIFLKKEEERKAKVSTGNKNSYWKWHIGELLLRKLLSTQWHSKDVALKKTKRAIRN